MRRIGLLAAPLLALLAWGQLAAAANPPAGNGSTVVARGAGPTEPAATRSSATEPAVNKSAATKPAPAASAAKKPPPAEPAAGKPARVEPAAAAAANGRTAPGKPRRERIREAAARPTAPVPSGPVLRIAVEGAYPPFSEVDAKGRLKGFDIDIARAVCAELAVQCVFVQKPWAVIQDAVIGLEPELWNEVDAIVASVSITDKRRETADFTRKYYHSPARFVRKVGSGVEPVAGKLRGRRIAVQGSTTHDEFVTTTFGGEATILRFETLPQALAAVKDGRADLVLADALALQRGFLETKDGAGFEYCGPAFTEPRWFGQGVGIVVEKGDRALLAKLDGALQALKARGEHAKIAKAYFAFDVDPR
ncbi:MAG: transporter substrate-binding domain-containing protein [Geminicoccaceae bacterium]|nr:transporter substrate-binding domain-containing protein [Geminicoccaceae bacterium]